MAVSSLDDTKLCRATGLQSCPRARVAPWCSQPLKLHRSIGNAERQNHVIVHAAAGATSSPARVSKQYSCLQGQQVHLVSEQRVVDITSLWEDRDVAVVFWARSMGCFFCQELARQLSRDVLPQLEAKGVKAFLVTIGTAERGLEFADLTSFPATNLLADPDSVTYTALGLRKGIVDMFFSPQTPLSIGARIAKDGASGLREAIGSWKPWIPPNKGQSRQQGGTYIFRGQECIYEHKDLATGAHADLDEVVRTALSQV